MADAQASGACGSNTVWVQVPSPASEGAKQNINGSGFAPFYAVKALQSVHLQGFLCTRAPRGNMSAEADGCPARE